MTTGTPTEPADGLDRRSFVKGAAALAVFVSGTKLYCPTEAWGIEVRTLQPQTMRTLIQMARDIYPHDKVATRFYAIAMKGYDAEAGKDAALKTLLEDGVKALDTAAKAAHGRGYADVGWEAQRVRLLKAVETSPFFQKVRSNLVVSLYNQKDVWPIFGYEGSSADKGGYIDRGFNDIAWL
jgi:hypothetical protein